MRLAYLALLLLLCSGAAALGRECPCDAPWYDTQEDRIASDPVLSAQDAHADDDLRDLRVHEDRSDRHPR